MEDADNMKSDAPLPHSAEIELKLAIPSPAPPHLAQRLGSTALLSHRQATVRHLHNIYYDTPDQALHRARTALRIRRIGGEENPRWVQTLKMGGASDSALSQRGEWETAVPGGALDWHALQATPWSQWDPDGKIFQALAPCFTTRFERTSWLVHPHDGCAVEVALDVGQIEAGANCAPICELEFELLSGQPTTLFDVAQDIARTIATLPANTSKAERGYALAQNTLNRPVRARPPELRPGLSLHEAAGQVLREMFGQFTSNLHALCTSDSPEVVHQARVGWRRFKSALRLFRPVLAVPTPPPWQALQALIADLGGLRDLDVARNDTLPPFLDAFAENDAQRTQAFQAVMHKLATANRRQRKAVRLALQTPAIGAALLTTSQWLEDISVPPELGHARTQRQKSLQAWARRRTKRLYARLNEATKGADSAEGQHRIRILAKRLRYGIEALQPLLWEKRAWRWHQHAVALQTHIGGARDVTQAATLVEKVAPGHGLVEFLRGVTFGQNSRKMAAN